MTTHDSIPGTLSHMRMVQQRVAQVIYALVLRSGRHDMSKLLPPERVGYDAASLRLAGIAYGSADYRAALDAMQPTLAQHYAANDHHPEHYTADYESLPAVAELDAVIDGLHAVVTDSVEAYRHRERAIALLREMRSWYTSPVNGMSLVALLEMLADWSAATQRTAGGDVARSMAVNAARFALGPQVRNLLRNTAVELQWDTTEETDAEPT